MSLGMYTKHRVEFVRMRGPNVSICFSERLDVRLLIIYKKKSDRISWIYKI